MAITVQRASDVRIQEINLSQTITSASSSVACQIIVGKQGRTEQAYFTNSTEYLFEYGNPDAQVSFDIYCGLDYFREGDKLWALRVVGAGARTSAVLLYSDSNGVHLKPVVGGLQDPKNPDWGSLVTSGQIALAVFYPSRGPGSYGDGDKGGNAISIQSSNLNTPTGLATTSSATGGSMVAGTYQYQISAIGPQGETLVSNPSTQVITGVAVTNSVSLQWNLLQGAWGYKIYGRTDDGLGLLAQVGQGTASFTDTGALVPDVTKQPITSAADLPAASNLFTVNAYQLSDANTPVESFNCTFLPFVDGDGQNTELENRINAFSQYIGVTSNVTVDDVVPTIVADIPRENMAGGDSGAAVTSFDIAAAWAKFNNRQLFGINLLINGGHSDPNVQRSMDALAQRRGDSVGMLDVPSNQQRYQQAINYRNLDLNLNSSYSGLFNPDVLEADNINGKNLYVPFSGWAAALAARTDRVANPSFSIAGLNRGLLDILGTRYSFEDAEASELFRAQVNYTRTFIGQGTALWEQQTLSSPPSALSWISVRRIVNTIKTAIYNMGVFYIQEPNDEFTARAIVAAFSEYLENVKNARGLHSYQVISDSRNNTAALLNQAIRRVTIILVPTLPLHELQVQIVITKQGIQFDEVLAQVGNQ